MDKYTVDLDKVLNDFEYSELTDQYNSSNSVSTPQRQHDLYKYNSAPPKHTITKVFESLNEYLNTDIGTKSEPSVSQNLNSENLIDSVPQLPETLIPISTNQINEKILIETEVPKSDTNSILVETIVEEKLPETIIEKLPETVVEKLSENVVQQLPENVVQQLPETVVEELAVTVVEELSETVVEQLPESDINRDETETSEQIVDEITVNNKKTVIGFDVNIDETDLREYLNELESEILDEDDALIAKSENSNVPNITITDSELSIVNNQDESSDDNNLSRPSSLPINNSSTQIDLVGEPGSTPYNNMYVSNTLTKPHESDGDSSPSPSPTFSEVSTESNGSTATTESVTDSIAEKVSAPIEKVDDVEASGENDNIRNIELDSSINEGMENLLATTSEHTDNSLGKQAPVWIPDSDSLNCLHCDSKFTVIKRRHHCRACGLVLCAKCCNKRYKLEYLNEEARVCLKCYDILNKDTNSSSGSEGLSSGNSPNHQNVTPNPNNPMEYCSMVPPLQQVNSSNQNPPSVLVPVGVLKRKGATKSRTNKSVMFCDGIRPGSELTNLDNDFNYNDKLAKESASFSTGTGNKNDFMDGVTKSFIPNKENLLPPIVNIYKSDISYTPCENNIQTIELLKKDKSVFAIHSNLYVHVKIINMDCCINKWAWCFSTEGLINVGQDEVVILLEYIDGEKTVPKDIFFHLNSIYNDAKTGSSITEHGISLHNTNNFLDSKNHMGFLYIRPTFQCLQNVIVPKELYLIGILIHRWEMPWAKIFPLRLILRLGAEYRYYPSPIVSTRHRESVFVEIGHTIINLLADFRNFSYTLPNIRGLTIHMEEKNTTVTIPLNRYDQVVKSLNNSSDHILAFGGNFSVKADSHLVCIQDTQGTNENTYTTHAINIHNRPRKVTGASFIVFNGALKSSSGLTAKSSIIEDGLMIQILPERMVQIRESLRNMKNHTIQCGCINAVSDETINIVWGDNDVNFNLGVHSSIDNQLLASVPSIRVHNGKDFICNSGNKLIRWTEVFIIQSGDENARGVDIDFSKLAENISKATCQALVKYLDLLLSNNFYKIGIRTNLHMENVSYSAGSNGIKLPPIYMKSLDNELIPVLHKITSNSLGDSAITLELVFRILNV